MGYCEWNVPEQDITNYLGACRNFCSNEQRFNNFKRDPSYKVILEHVTYEAGLILVDQMKNPDIITEEQLRKCKENDLYGNAEINSYEGFGDISPSTIRYIKNSLDILNFVGDQVSDLENIVEIGGGYGGLCKVLSSFVDYENYLIIDLPEVNGLSNKYLSHFPDLEGRTSQLSCFELDEVVGADLVVSNYAFSECSEEIQMHYFNDVIVHASRIYMVYNNFTKGNINSDGFIDLASEHFELEVEDDSAHGASNVIIYGTKRGE